MLSAVEQSYECDKLRSILTKTLESALSEIVRERNPSTLSVHAESQGYCPMSSVNKSCSLAKQFFLSWYSDGTVCGRSM